jgi:hypothetical protein
MTGKSWCEPHAIAFNTRAAGFLVEPGGLLKIERLRTEMYLIQPDALRLRDWLTQMFEVSK